MKTLFTKMVFWQSLLSSIILSVFILLASGSIGALFVPNSKTQHLGNKIYRETVFGLSRVTRIITGERDENRNWNGKVTIEWQGKDPYKEEVRMAHGVRQGISKCTYPDGMVVEYHYVGNKVYRFKKAANTLSADVSAYQVLNDKYSWLPFSLNACGFPNRYIKAFTDTLEKVLYSYNFEVTKFDEYYEDVLDELEKTPYDSIITLYSDLFLIQGLDELKNAEFRLAVLDHYRSANRTTYSIINTTYPGYLLTMNNSGVTTQDFENFCKEVDDSLKKYGPLDLKDPFFTDSVDARIFRALFGILDLEIKSSLSEKSVLKSTDSGYINYEYIDLYREVNSIIKSLNVKANPSQQVASVVVSDMLQLFAKGDILRVAVREAYLLKKGILWIPELGTEFIGNNSATSVTLKGYVLEDGGASVTSRGITWAAFYNPTINDNKINSGTGTGDFSITLNGLTEGTTYYARSFATNSAGTAYGNCISFNTNITTAINDIKPLFTQDFSIYPNPASSFVTLNFKLATQGKIQLIVIDMKGQIVLKREPGNLPQGENEIYLDISALQNGLYTCILTNGVTKVMQKLLIAR